MKICFPNTTVATLHWYQNPVPFRAVAISTIGSIPNIDTDQIYHQQKNAPVSHTKSDQCWWSPGAIVQRRVAAEAHRSQLGKPFFSQATATQGSLHA